MEQMKWLYVMLVLCCKTPAFGQWDTTGKIAAHYRWSLEQLAKKGTKNVLVIAHRCGWRFAPENSIPAVENCIRMGFDIAELDVKSTKDGHLVIMHDDSIDRTTTGKGRPEDWTLAELKTYKLRSGNGHKTVHIIPTLEELLDVARHKIILDIDKAYPWFDVVVKELTDRGMLEQSIYNIYGLPLDSVRAHHPDLPDALTLMLIVNAKDTGAERIISSYRTRLHTIIQITFEKEDNHLINTVPVLKTVYGIWFNALWPEQCGCHDDDTAVEEDQPDQTWGWLVKKGANIIQTDRPKELLDYLRQKGLHE